MNVVEHFRASLAGLVQEHLIQQQFGSPGEQEMQLVEAIARLGLARTAIIAPKICAEVRRCLGPQILLQVLKLDCLGVTRGAVDEQDAHRVGARKLVAEEELCCSDQWPLTAQVQSYPGGAAVWLVD